MFHADGSRASVAVSDSIASDTVLGSHAFAVDGWRRDGAILESVRSGPRPISTPTLEREMAHAHTERLAACRPERGTCLVVGRRCGVLQLHVG